MPRNTEQHRRSPRARRLAFAGALACLVALAMAAPATAFPSNVSPPPTPSQTGRTLITEDGSWLLASSFTYGWYRCDAAGAGCAQVPGRTGTAYLLTSADIGRRIRSLVIAHNALGSNSAFSSPTVVIAPQPPVNQVSPTVTGTARRGSVLSSTIGSWSDPSLSAVSYRRQWQRCASAGAGCQNVPGATAPSYILGAEDVGRVMRVAVTAEGLGADSAVSGPLGPILDLPGGGGEDPGEGGSGNGDNTAPTGGFRKLRPFPVIVLAGRLVRGRTHISRLEVRGPRGAAISVRCRGRGCPSRSYRTRLRGSRRTRLRRFQRTYAAGAVIEIRVTGKQAIGKFTRIGIRATRPPSRRDSCLVPGKTRPSRCP